MNIWRKGLAKIRDLIDDPFFVGDENDPNVLNQLAESYAMENSNKKESNVSHIKRRYRFDHKSKSVKSIKTAPLSTLKKTPPALIVVD